MNVIPFVHEGLGNSSYLVAAGDGRALLIDPDRTISRYVAAAEERGWRIEAVLETHLHADFVSGAHELAAALGAKLLIPAGANSRLPHQPLEPGNTIQFGGIEIAPIASPGHTPEHLSYALRPSSGPPALFSGGSLIIGGAARTDLIDPQLTDELSRAQYRTITTAFSALPDDTALYPTHGGGSFCSTGSGAARASTLGAERRSNPLLSIPSEDEFVAWFPTTFPSTPAYYARMRGVNQAGPRLRREIAMPRCLAPDAFKAALAGSAVIDARPAASYAGAHVAGSISIPFRDSFAVWLGWVTPPDADLIFVPGDVPVGNIVDEALLVGYERFAGVLDGEPGDWERAGLPLKRGAIVAPGEARRSLLDGATALDVREPDEYAAGHIPDAVHIPLGDLARRAGELPPDRPIVAYCGYGDRAATAASLLERAGRGPVLNLEAGISGWRREGLDLDVGA